MSMEQMQQLYQQVILDHNKNPKNFRKMESHTHKQEGHNPVCGDHLHIYLQIEDDVISDISFIGEGCAISKASASMMTQTLKGKTLSKANETFENFHRLLTKKMDSEEAKTLGKLQIFSGIWKYPARVKCAGLSWHTLKAILQNGPTQGPIKTE